MSNLTERDLQAVAKAFGDIFTVDEIFTIAQKHREVDVEGWETPEDGMLHRPG